MTFLHGQFTIIYRSGDGNYDITTKQFLQCLSEYGWTNVVDAVYISYSFCDV